MAGSPGFLFSCPLDPDRAALRTLQDMVDDCSHLTGKAVRKILLYWSVKKEKWKAQQCCAFW